MKTLINRVNKMKQSLKGIQDIFKGNPHLDNLEIQCYSEEDDRDINLTFIKVVINLAEYDLEDMVDEYDDNETMPIEDIEDGIMSKPELVILRDSLETLLNQGNELDCNMIIIKREEILKIEI